MNSIDTEEFTMMRTGYAAMLAVASFGLAVTAGAHELSLGECQEARDFIRNAALSRDSGLSRSEFMGRFDDDIALIRFYPPDLRWFVQDDDDERLLRAAAEQVFDEPDEPERHGDAFLGACYGMVADLTPK